MGRRMPMPKARADRWETTAQMRSSVVGEGFIGLVWMLIEFVIMRRILPRQCLFQPYLFHVALEILRRAGTLLGMTCGVCGFILSKRNITYNFETNRILEER
jgi:hypothetical protein